MIQYRFDGNQMITLKDRYLIRLEVVGRRKTRAIGLLIYNWNFTEYILIL